MSSGRGWRCKSPRTSSPRRALSWRHGPRAASEIDQRPPIDGQHVGDAVAGEVTEAEVVQRERRALHRLPVRPRQRGDEPLPVGRTAEGVRGLPGDARDECRATSGSKRPSLTSASGTPNVADRRRGPGGAVPDHPLPEPLDQHVAVRVVVEVAEVELRRGSPRPRRGTTSGSGRRRRTTTSGRWPGRGRPRRRRRSRRRRYWPNVSIPTRLSLVNTALSGVWSLIASSEVSDARRRSS